MQRVVVPVERVYQHTRQRVESTSGGDWLKYLAWSAGSGIATHYATLGAKKLIHADGDNPRHDPLWVSAPVAAASVVAALQLKGSARAAAVGAALNAGAQVIKDGYQHLTRPNEQAQQLQERRNQAPTKQLAAAYEAARRELAAQRNNAYAAAQAQQAAMYGASYVPGAVY